MENNNTQNMMTFNKTCLTVAITYLVIYECLSFSLSQKPRYKKVVNLTRAVSKSYQPPNRNLISKDIYDVINYQNM